jgi:plasmid stabilization system protein ParE
MGRRTDPRPGSAQHKLMTRLIELGGVAQASQLVAALSAEHQRVSEFARIGQTLELLGFIDIQGSTYRALRCGKEYVSKYNPSAFPKPGPYVGQVAPSRTPLSAVRAKPSSTVGAMPIREGAFDYRNIPSLMGSSRKLPNGEVVE